VTGYADIEAVKATLGADQLILRKPYHFDALITAVAHALRHERSNGLS
jgi:FixJ family two-component response regulator